MKTNSFLIVIICLFNLFGCSPSRPSDEEIISAVRKQFFTQTIYVSIERVLISSGKRVFQNEYIQPETITELKIDKVGDYNSTNKYWPVKIILQGPVASYNMWNGENGRTNHYGEFRIFYDDFKNIKAEFVDTKLFWID